LDGRNYRTGAREQWLAQTGRCGSATGPRVLTLDGMVQTPPAVANGLIYVVTTRGQLYAFSAATGAEVWSRSVGGGVRFTPAVSGGRVYVGSSNQDVSAFDARTGKPLWHTSVGVNSPVAVANGTVYAATSGGLCALNSRPARNTGQRT
jgi:outer membrane protein assembly factor BamB